LVYTYIIITLAALSSEKIWKKKLIDFA